MRKFILTMAAALVAAFALSACNKAPEQAAAPTEQKVESVPVPAADADTATWKKYLVSVVQQNMQGVKTNRPYMYFVPGGDDDVAKDNRANQLENVRGVVARSVLPGNMMAFGGPDSAITADFVIDAFKEASAGSFKDVVVLVVGAAADHDRLKEALAPSGANFRFVEMK